VVWELVREGSRSDDVATLISSVLALINQLKQHLGPVCASADTTCLLRVVQYVGDDPFGPGLEISAEEIGLLAELSAFLDIDQYWVVPEPPQEA
jgi:Domain of unknown function (DUF4279)